MVNKITDLTTKALHKIDIASTHEYNIWMEPVSKHIFRIHILLSGYKESYIRVAHIVNDTFTSFEDIEGSSSATLAQLLLGDFGRWDVNEIVLRYELPIIAAIHQCREH